LAALRTIPNLKPPATARCTKCGSYMSRPGRCHLAAPYLPRKRAKGQHHETWKMHGTGWRAAGTVCVSCVRQ
jgi:hypothetical protein